MELLIPGLLLVALMVYASTRIKRAAKAAFDAETIETDEFTFEKPAGFLNVINLDPAYLLEIYSQEFGTDGAEEFRAARGEMRVPSKRKLSAALATIRSAEDVTSERTEVIGGRKYTVVEANAEQKGVAFKLFFKLAEKDGRTFEIRLEMLAETNDEISRKIDTMLSTFTLK